MGCRSKFSGRLRADGFIIGKTETKTDLTGQLDHGRIDFAMFKGNYEVEVQGRYQYDRYGYHPRFWHQ